MARYELFGTASFPYTGEVREWLEWQRADFVDYNVEADAEARGRPRELVGEQRTIPILVEEGKVVQVGWQGKGCVIGN